MQYGAQKCMSNIDAGAGAGAGGLITAGICFSFFLFRLKKMLLSDYLQHINGAIYPDL